MTNESTDLTEVTAVDLAQLLRTREVTPSEITEAVLAKIERLNPILGAFLTVTADAAREEAVEADLRALRGEFLSPMDGIPYSIKDLEPTVGIRTTNGSRFYSDTVPTENSAVADLLRSSGGILLGKTNTPHFGYKDMCDNFVGPTALNPWDTRMTPGGSSGGAASAIAAGLGPLAQGSDGAGSIRIPAALTGVVGFKPTFGRIPLYPASNPWTTRTHNGPLTRTVADAALMLRVMSVPDDRDPLSLMSELAPFTALDGVRPLAGRRALLSMDFGYGIVSAEVEKKTREAVSALEALGCVVDEFEGSPWFNPAGFHSVLYVSGGLPAIFDEHPEWIESDFAALIQRGAGRSGRDMVQAEKDRAAFYQNVLASMSGYDFIVSPAMPLEAWPATPGRGPREIDGKPLDEATSRAFLVYPFNLTGQPAISLPAGLSSNGLPVGFQIVGRREQDILVLQAAAALEKELDLAHPWPVPTFRPEGVDALVAA